jgi:hypothetical protein
MAGRIPRFLLALTVALSVWTPLAFGHGQMPPAAWEGRALSWPVPGQAAAGVAAGALLLAGVLLAALPALRRKAGGRPGVRELRARSRLVTPPLAGALLALLLWVLPWLSLHDTHHALERAAPVCAVAQIVHSQGAGILPATVALAQPLPADIAPLPAPAALSSRSAPPAAARSPPV